VNKNKIQFNNLSIILLYLLPFYGQN